MKIKFQVLNINFKNILNMLIRCIKLLADQSKLFVIFTIIISAIQGVIPALSLSVMQKVLNELQVSNGTLKIIIIWILVYISLGIIEFTLNTVYSYISIKFNFKFEKNLKIKILNKATEFNLKDYENSEIYNMINRAQNEGNGKITAFFNSFVAIFRLFVQIISALVILIKFKIWIIMVIVIIPYIRYIYSIKVGKKQFLVQKSRTTQERKLWYISYLLTSGHAYKEIKLLNLKKFFINRYNKLANHIIEQDLDILKKSNCVNFILNLFDEIISGTVFFYIVYNGFIKTILVGDVITYTRCIFNIKSYTQSVLNSISSFSKDTLFLSMFFEFLDFDTIDKRKKENEIIEIDNIKSIELKNLSYKYNQKEYVLKDVNLKITCNDLVAIVGRNGSGKTTLIKIILGLYDEYEGEILINGINLRNINKDVYFEKIGVVFQDFVKFEASIRENISYGDLQKYSDNYSLTQIMSDFDININSFEHLGLDTFLGSWFDEGQQLSLGEWQKIAISRAFIKEANLFIMDELNASLDSESEFLVLEQCKKKLENKIGILITHRLYNIKSLTNNIIVLDKGKIIERGTHENLIEKQGIYYELYCKQKGC